LQNQWISRIVAVSGQNVRLKDRQLLVDGQRSFAPPPAEMAAELEAGFVVPQGSVFMALNSFIPAGARMNADVWRRLSIVPHGSIRGRIFFRSQPLWRMSTMQGIE
jgi:hypothetical protein